MTPPPVWMVALIGGCRDAAEYARGYQDPRAALHNASAGHREWLRLQLDGSGFGYGYGDGRGGGDGDGRGGGGVGFGDGDGDGDGRGYGAGDGRGGGGGGCHDGGGYGYAPPLRVRADGEWWDSDRVLAWAREVGA